MKIVPLTGQVLVEILPRDQFTAGGIEIPDRIRSPEEVQASHHDPQKPPPIQGVVKAIGKWPKLKCGLAMMPEFGVGAKVIIGSHSGVRMARGIGENYKMIRQQDVLAIITDSVHVRT